MTVAPPVSTGIGERLLAAYGRHFPLRQGKVRLVNALWEPLSRRHGPMRLARLKHGGFIAPCDLREMLQRQFYFFGTYLLEDKLLRCWTAAARNAEVVIDVGANAGIYSLAALGANPAATVHAFEPTPEIADRLRITAAMNGLTTLHVHELAVFSSAGLVALRRFRGEFGDNEGMNFVSSQIGGEAEVVRATSLDEFCDAAAISAIDLLKIDIQGHEATALRGAERLLGAGRIGTIFIELNWADDGEAESSASEAVRYLAAAGYRFATPGPRPVWREAGEWMTSTDDVMARRLAPPGDVRR